MSALDRRRFLRGTLLGAGAAGTLAASTGSSADEATSSAGAAPVFHGRHQNGILPEPSRHTAIAAFDVIAGTPGELRDLLRTLTDRLRRLTTGGTPTPVGITAPPEDSGVLGPEPPGGVRSVVGVGASLFDERFGLAARKPAALTPMREFPNDDLDSAQCHGDLSLQLSAEHPDTVLHALRDLARHTRGGMQLRWRVDGFTSPPRPDGAPRNLMGFKDGTANPDPADSAEMDRLVWARPEPEWTAGGSYQVIRLIRMLVEFWDRISVNEQELIFGRRRDSGAPLDGSREADAPDYRLDPAGAVVPLSSHIRMANPRTPDTDAHRILRRSYNYDRGIDEVGDLDMGLVFTCFQQDPARQFEQVQTRLVDEPLTDYIAPFGGGYFFALPGVRDESDHLGRSLLADL
ncbi:Dyp-type peroxidase [Saccharopolyspora flava]|uniref:Deferrochelatase/peroxidase EfeB n=1 Tax=Saccharopolyspora flava TaxID=95161 RepID=A0A1I6U2S1_9PSEU|nr:Dyp-type peroxidase [Saccharopolyspora flava]SFS95809.1 deferrochelatase/peroxidase EfeB [Saccharopolyspora flava]